MQCMKQGAVQLHRLLQASPAMPCKPCWDQELKDVGLDAAFNMHELEDASIIETSYM